MSSEREYEIDSLDLEAHGVARDDGKVAFVRGALPGERVRARVVRRKPRFDVAETTEVLRPGALRAQPRCPHFGVCGGCSMQHVDPRAQVAIKQRALEDTLWHVGRVRAQQVLRPLQGPAWGYRYRARLSVRDVPKKGGVLVGFHERGSSYVADIRECHVLPPRVSALLLPLRGLVEGLSLRQRLPQVEVACGDDTVALVLRVLQPPTADDERQLREFARRHDVELW
ncbi:MAG TPA: TRAM domain-containing protein, partial [Burkholderiaceae bacterium]|nr:TRAM domain-containing protein [Burkholderiaceae bacterium]